ncbi:hypothetical protein BCL90_1504 [Pedobacter alluvionis]|uniref:Uncharacterized protein n=1 Tax=Pedobacter alluvionis TaxID=475253 RepID=A0A497YKW0_9SPHI|nr:hypothetical protein BCL90_1504 [Pedobacter alluvionis]
MYHGFFRWINYYKFITTIESYRAIASNSELQTLFYEVSTKKGILTASNKTTQP